MTKDVVEMPDDIEYRFDEKKHIQEAADWIVGTYKNYHYSKSGFQATEVIIDAGHGTGFNIGNIIKYAKRYGHKGGFNKQDLLKIVHYAVMQLYVHDRDNAIKDIPVSGEID